MDIYDVIASLFSFIGNIILSLISLIEFVGNYIISMPYILINMFMYLPRFIQSGISIVLICFVVFFVIRFINHVKNSRPI